MCKPTRKNICNTRKVCLSDDEAISEQKPSTMCAQMEEHARIGTTATTRMSICMPEQTHLPFAGIPAGKNFFDYVLERPTDCTHMAIRPSVVSPIPPHGCAKTEGVKTPPLELDSPPQSSKLCATTAMQTETEFADAFIDPNYVPEAIDDSDIPPLPFSRSLPPSFSHNECAEMSRLSLEPTIEAIEQSQIPGSSMTSILPNIPRPRPLMSRSATVPVPNAKAELPNIPRPRPLMGRSTTVPVPNTNAELPNIPRPRPHMSRSTSVPVPNAETELPNIPRPRPLMSRSTSVPVPNGKAKLLNIPRPRPQMIRSASVPVPNAKAKQPAQRRPPRRDARWMGMLSQLRKYKDSNGSCNVPQIYEPKPKLAKWVCEQRKQYRLLQSGSKSSVMTPTRIELLEDLGFEWSK